MKAERWKKLRNILETDISGPIVELIGPALEVAGWIFGILLFVGLILALCNPALVMLLWIGMGG